MTDDAPQEEQPAPYVIEPARSSRSKCKSCRKKIEKGNLRIGFLIEGPFGQGYLWHHLKCAARRQLDRVEEAYELECWDADLEVPPIEELRKEASKAEKKKKEKKLAPYAERAPTGRSKCKHCDGAIEKGAWRVALLRTVEFGGQTRAGPINVHPTCVPEAIFAEDCATEVDDFEEKLRENSGLPSDEVDEALAEVGPLSPD